MNHNSNFSASKLYGYQARVIQQLIGTGIDESNSQTPITKQKYSRTAKQNHTASNNNSKFAYTHQSGKIQIAAKHQKMPLHQNNSQVFQFNQITSKQLNSFKTQINQYSNLIDRTHSNFNFFKQRKQSQKINQSQKLDACEQKGQKSQQKIKLQAQQQQHQFYFSFQICVDIGDGRQGAIKINQNSDPFLEARRFCQKYSLDSYIIPILGKSICQQKQSEKLNIFNQISERISKIHENRIQSQQTNPNQCLVNQYHAQSQNTFLKTFQQNQANKQKRLKKPLNQLSKTDLRTNIVQTNKRNSINTINTNPSRVWQQNSSFNNTLKSTKCMYRLSKYENKDIDSKVSINQISQQIVDKMGRQNIVLRKKSRSQQKIAKIKKQNQQLLQKQREECVFHPKINKLSCLVDQFLQQKNNNLIGIQIETSGKKTADLAYKNKRGYRYEQLYQNWKVIQQKKEQSRKNSIQKLTFKPQINPISKKIAQKMNSSTSQDYMVFQIKREKQDKASRFLQNSLQKVKKNSVNFSNQKNSKRKSVEQMNASHSNLPSRKNSSNMLKGRNSSNLPIGQYLYSQAKKRSLKRQKIIKEQTQQPTPNILTKSHQIVQLARQNRLRQVFNFLKRDNHQTLRFQDIQWDKLSQLQLIFEPIFREMKQTNFDLNQQQFVSAGKRLIKYLSQRDKAILLNNIRVKECKEKSTQKKNHLNKKSYEMVAGNQLYIQCDIYERGRIQRSRTNDKIERFKQDLVRKELQQCSFKPLLQKTQQWQQ